MAEAYLDRPRALARWVVVAGEETPHVDSAHDRLHRAAAAMGVPTLTWGHDHEGVDLELGHDRMAPVLVYHHGAVAEDQLAQLPPPPGESPDLLLWTLSDRPRIGLRSLYLLSLFCWSLAPRQVRCLWPSRGHDAATWVRVQARLRGGLAHAGVERPVELLAFDPEAENSLFAQVLHSLLSAPRPPSRVTAPDPRNPSRSGPNSLARGAMLLLVFLAGMFADSVAVAQEAPRLVTIELEGIGAETREEDFENAGGRLLVGRYFTLHLKPGTGVWNREGSSVSIQTPRDNLVLRSDGVAVEWQDATWSVNERLVLTAPEASLVVRQGQAELVGSVLRVSPQVKGPPLPGKQGLLLTAGLAMVIFFLFMRASTARRRLDEPRQSLRRRGRPTEVD